MLGMRCMGYHMTAVSTFFLFFSGILWIIVQQVNYLVQASPVYEGPGVCIGVIKQIG